jgi:Tol biopolymer transport system component
MKKKSIMSVMILLIFFLTACTGTGSAPTSTPDEDTVATAVATMMSGRATDTPLPEPTTTLTPEPSILLPRDLYYLAQDANGKGQIFRLSRDGITVTQITFEQDGINGFDISPIDGIIVYAIQNNLIAVDTNGESRRMLVQDVNNISGAIWSPDGKIIAYKSGKDGVVYSFDTGEKEVLFSDSDNERSWFISFSPDSSKLAIGKHTSPSAPGGVVHIYGFSSRTLKRLSEENICYNNRLVWNSSETLFCYGHIFAGAVRPGLFLMNATDSSVETLIFSTSCPPCSPVAAPSQHADGNLYYLYEEIYEVGGAYPPLTLFRSAQDGITDRVKVRPEAFNVLDAVWTPDGDALVIIQNDGTHSSPADLVLVPLDPSLPVVTLMVDIAELQPYSLQWGL